MDKKKMEIASMLNVQQNAEGIDLDTQIYALTSQQRKVLKILLSAAEPISTSRIRFALINIAFNDKGEKKIEEHLFFDIDRASASELFPTTENIQKKIISARELNHKIPSYEGLETDLKILNDGGFIYKIGAGGKNAKFLWALRSEFVAAYLKRKRELAKHMVESKDKYVRGNPFRIQEFYGV